MGDFLQGLIGALQTYPSEMLPFVEVCITSMNPVPTANLDLPELGAIVATLPASLQSKFINQFNYAGLTIHPNEIDVFLLTLIPPTLCLLHQQKTAEEFAKVLAPFKEVEVELGNFVEQALLKHVNYKAAVTLTMRAYAS